MGVLDGFIITEESPLEWFPESVDKQNHYTNWKQNFKIKCSLEVYKIYTKLTTGSTNNIWNMHVKSHNKELLGNLNGQVTWNLKFIISNIRTKIHYMEIICPRENEKKITISFWLLLTISKIGLKVITSTMYNHHNQYHSFFLFIKLCLEE